MGGSIGGDLFVSSVSENWGSYPVTITYGSKEERTEIGTKRRMYGGMEGWVDGRKDDRMDRRKAGRVDGPNLQKLRSSL